jgi:outer membrane protein OmpA-like peptidoglycan-associated protein
MSPIKVMPLLLTTITPFVMVSGVSRAAEPQIILAQAQTAQQQEEERKRREHEKAQEQQRAQQQKQQQDQKKAQEQQHAQQDRQAQDQKKAQEQKQLLDQKKAQEQKKPQEQHTQEQHPGPGQAKLPDHKDGAPGNIKSDQAKGQQQQQQHNAAQPSQQQQKAVAQPHQPNAPQRQLSATDQKAKAERDAHAQDRQKLIAKQQQAATNERSQAAISERLKLQNERLRSISSQRQQTVDRHGQTVITEPGNRTIIQVNKQVFIRHDETINFRLYGGNAQTVRAPNGNSVSTIVRPDGVRLEIEVDSYGRPLRRVRIFPNGRRFVLFENRPIEAGVGFALGSFIVDLAPPRIIIPREQYIVDADLASEDDIYGALWAPPVEPLDRGYSLDEVLASVGLRERMRSVSISSINFEFGSWEVGPEQAQMLEAVAAVMRDIANQNPGEVFLVEGHTDAVGSVVDNLSLSDRRASAVAEVLSQQFGIPRENLVTQGYGKQFLLIPTDEPERRNRRVVVRRITPLLGGDTDRYSSGYGGQGDGRPR